MGDFDRDALSIPDPGTDANRVKPFTGGQPPADDGFPKEYGVNAPSSLPGEPGSTPVNLTLAGNQFPRETGHDSLSPEEAQLS